MPTSPQPDKLLAKILAQLDKASLNVPELLSLCGKLLYTIGASMSGFTKAGPSLEVLEREYYTNPCVDVALMIQGQLISTWIEDYTRNPKLSKLAERMEETNDQD
jgi:hypothetical protein